MLAQSDFFNVSHPPTEGGNQWANKSLVLNSLRDRDQQKLACYLENMTVLDLSSETISLAELQFFKNNLHGCLVNRMHLDQCDFEDIAVDELISILNVLPQLKLVTLNDNHFTEKAGLALLKVFKRHPNLLRFELKQNKIDKSAFAMQEQDIINNDFQQALLKALDYFSIQPKQDLIFKRDFPKAKTQIQL